MVARLGGSAIVNFPFRPADFDFEALTRTRSLDRVDDAAGVRGMHFLHGVRRASPTPRAQADQITKLAGRAAFDAIANSAEQSGGMPEVKFLIDRETQQAYFIPKDIPYHYYFAKQVLGYRGTEAEFLRDAYVRPDRRYIAGTITAFDNFEDPRGNKGLFGISYWATDPVRAPMILETHRLLAAGMPFAKPKLAYRPLGTTQEQLLEAEGAADKRALDAAGLKIFTRAELTKSFTFMALVPGKTFGTLRVVDGPGDAGPPLSRRDIAIFAGEMPVDLPPLAGLATPRPQTFLSHSALKARQDKTPYAYSRDILADPKVQALVGKVVSFEVTPKGYSIKAATQAEADAHFEKLRPKHEQVLKPNLTPRAIRALDDLSFKDSRAYGSKVCNVAELRRLWKGGRFEFPDRADDEPKVVAPDGFGVPARTFADFMKKAKYDAHLTFAQRRDQMVRDPRFKKDLAARREMLAEIQEKLELAVTPTSILRQLEALKPKFKAKFPGDDIRIRSSSSSEDLEGFSGAGLFDSYTFKWKNENEAGKTFANRLQKVFGSVFNERAFAELDFYRVRPDTVTMAELLMPATKDEVANGVVSWGGPIPGWDAITVNAQVRDELVTNPENGATPDAITVANYGFRGELEIQYEARTNQQLEPGRSSALTDGELRALFKAMKVVQQHFAKLYGKENDPTFSIECEFKITKAGELLIKQARPWVN